MKANLDILIRKRGFTYSMIAAYCGLTPQRWQQIYKGGQEKKDLEGIIQDLVVFAEKRDILGPQMVLTLLAQARNQ